MQNIRNMKKDAKKRERKESRENLERNIWRKKKSKEIKTERNKG